MAEQNVQQLEQLYALKYDLFDRTPVLAQQNGSMIAQQMLNAVLEAIPGQTVSRPRRSAAERQTHGLRRP